MNVVDWLWKTGIIYVIVISEDFPEYEALHQIAQFGVMSRTQENSQI